MFDKNTRLVTRGILEQLPTEILVQIWMSVDLQLNAGLKMDALQTFTFERVGNLVLAIWHTQQVPERKTVIYSEYKSDFEKILNETVYVIDDGDHSTMLFATEY